ncbi:MAG: hypothetical protein WD646_11770 [Actinomycetota bacterium]
MRFRSRRTAASRSLRSDETGNILITVVIVSMLIGALTSLAMTTGQHANTSSTRDRNSEQALNVSEAGVHQAISRIDAQSASNTFVDSFSFAGSTAEGDYSVDVTRMGNDGFIIDSTGSVGGSSLGRDRRINVTFAPPELFPGELLALFSSTSIELKNNDILAGDIWANDSVLIRQGVNHNGSVTAAQSWFQLEGNGRVGGNVWSGGYNADGTWAIDVGQNSIIGGWAKASVTAPADPETCDGETHENYDVVMSSGSSIGGDLTTLGERLGGGSVGGTIALHTCTAAPAPRPLPEFNPFVGTFDNPDDPDDYLEFASVDAFQTWLTGQSGNIEGVLVVTEPAPSQANRINLSGANLIGDTTIVTNAPVFTNGIGDDGVADSAKFVVVSHYQAPISTGCDVNHDSSECAIHAKNNFDPDCRVAVLLYADNGPVAVKNNNEMCGTVVSEGILIKNNQELNVDPRVQRTVGFGPTTWEIARWEEIPP